MSSILDAKNSQFRLAEDGSISFQVVESNPLPGDVIARLEKGDSILKPNVSISDAKGADEAALVTRLEAWRDAHIGSVLELLVGLKEPLSAPEPKEGEAPQEPLMVTPVVTEIFDAVYDSMGILPREILEPLIAKLDADDRRVLRAKRVRLGPILVFIPALNKPAGVRLRGLLWAVYNGQPLPAGVPNDGIVSQVVDADAVNKDFYQAVGYPVFGNRAIRIDMLDRVICAVYDSADKGKFQAQHQMAEWLGCPIDDLYGILSAMGHKKIDAPQVADVATEEVVVEAALETDAKPETDVPVAAEDAEKAKEKPQEKPELAMFSLKRGKAFEQKSGERKAFKKPDAKKAGGKSFDQKKGKRNNNQREPKVMSAAAKKVEDSPFAILQQLKTGNDE